LSFSREYIYIYIYICLMIHICVHKFYCQWEKIKYHINLSMCMAPSLLQKPRLNIYFIRAEQVGAVIRMRKYIITKMPSSNKSKLVLGNRRITFFKNSARAQQSMRQERPETTSTLFIQHYGSPSSYYNDTNSHEYI